MTTKNCEMHQKPDDVEVTYLVWPHDRYGGWHDVTKERYDNAAPDDRMAVVQLSDYLTKEIRTYLEPVAWQAWSELLGFSYWPTLEEAQSHSEPEHIVAQVYVQKRIQGIG